MLTPKYFCRTAFIDSDIYVLGGYVGVKNLSCSIEMFSAKTNTWKELEYQTTDDIFTVFSVCSFIKSVYVVGCRFRYKDYCSTDSGKLRGGYYVKKYVKLCYKYVANKWTKVADLQNKRNPSACIVF